MTTKHALALSLTASAALIAGAALAADGGVKLRATMTGAAERPGPGDPNGTGTATFRVNPGKKQICYTLTVSNIAPATAAHIHLAPPTAPGPVVVPLTAPTTGTSSGCATVTRNVALAIIKNPANYYVNVHNAPFGPGAVRGQLTR